MKSHIEESIKVTVSYKKCVLNVKKLKYYVNKTQENIAEKHFSSSVYDSMGTWVWKQVKYVFTPKLSSFC